MSLKTLAFESRFDGMRGRSKVKRNNFQFLREHIKINSNVKGYFCLEHWKNDDDNQDEHQKLPFIDQILVTDVF